MVEPRALWLVQHHRAPMHSQGATHRNPPVKDLENEKLMGSFATSINLAETTTLLILDLANPIS